MNRRITNEEAPFPTGKDADWQRDALERANRLYLGWPDPVRMKRHDYALARTLRNDPCVIQYLETAPVLKWFVTARAVRAAMLRREKLAKIMRAAKLAPALRHVSGDDIVRCEDLNFGAHDAKDWRRLSCADNSLIAQALHTLPAGRMTGARGFKRIDALQWMLLFSNYAEVHEEPDVLDWALRALIQENGEEHKFNNADVFLDFIHRSDGPFNTRWTLDRTWSEVCRWHNRLANMRLGHFPDAPADYGNLPLDQTVDGYSFRGLRTVRQLHTEGRDMNHCVASYAEDVFFGKSRIYAINETAPGIERATLEIVFFIKNDAWTVEQVKGPYNATPSATLLAAVESFVRKINEARR